jgi:hypothetical protein
MDMKLDHSTQASTMRELSVALLLNDLDLAREVTAIFKKAGVHPHIYNDLREFWQGTLERLPSLCLVDVQMMSQGDLLLQHHPYVKAEQMPLSFFYSDETEPLMFSTYELYHLGTVRKKAPLAGQVKSILRRLNRQMNLEEKAHQEVLKNLRYDRQIEKLAEQFEALKEKDYYHHFLHSLSQQFEKRIDDEDFFQSIEAIIGRLKEVDEFSYVELSTSGQKLIAPESTHPKYRRIPTLWLGQTLEEGIAPFAQSMAAQVGVDLMGSELMSLSVRGKEQNPEALVFLKLNNEDMLDQFEWDSFERMLSNVYGSMQWRKAERLKGPERWMQPFELMSYLDSEFFKTQAPREKKESQEFEGEFRLIDLSFSGLMNEIQSKNHRFYWKIFFDDFLRRLNNEFRLDFKICPLGIEHVAFLVSAKDFDRLFMSLKAYSTRFPYWKYFHDTDTVLSRDWRPKVQQMPMASKGYLLKLKAAADEMDELSKTAETAKTKDEPQNLWGPEPVQSM